MNKALLLLAADLLDEAADEFGNHGCNDMSLPLLSDDDRKGLADLMNRSNFPSSMAPEQWPAEDVVTSDDLRCGCADFAAMRAMAFGLREFASLFT